MYIYTICMNTVYTSVEWDLALTQGHSNGLELRRRVFLWRTLWRRCHQWRIMLHIILCWEEEYLRRTWGRNVSLGSLGLRVQEPLLAAHWTSDQNDAIIFIFEYLSCLIIYHAFPEHKLHLLRRRPVMVPVKPLWSRYFLRTNHEMVNWNETYILLKHQKLSLTIAERSFWKIMHLVKASVIWFATSNSSGFGWFSPHAPSICLRTSSSSFWSFGFPLLMASFRSRLYAQKLQLLRFCGFCTNRG